MTGRPVTFSAGPFTRMRFSRWDNQIAPPDVVYYAQDVLIDQAGGPGVYRTRPGRYRVNSSSIGAGGGSVVGQLVYQFTKLDGTQYTVVIVDGKFYTLNWSTGVYTEVVTGANFATASITLSTTARCYAVTLNDKMIVSDGVNKPWTWDGTSGAGGLTSLTNAQVMYGQPTVYYAKLFGIKNTERSTIIWSNENDPTTGYESGYNNAWRLSQTGSDPLFAIRGTNDALFYWRQRSVGAIRGAVDTTFATTGVLDAVSTLVGTRSPAGVCVYNDKIYFPDEYGRPCAFAIGGQVESLWEQISLAFPTSSDDDDSLDFGLGTVQVSQTAADILKMVTVPWRGGQKMLFAYPAVGGAGPLTRASMFSATTGAAEAFWSLSNVDGVHIIGEVINSTTNLPELLMLDTGGKTFSLGLTGTWVDSGPTGSTNIIASCVCGCRHAATDNAEFLFSRVDFVMDIRPAVSVTALVQLPTSRLPTASGGLSCTVAADLTSPFTLIQKHVSAGFKRHGRWAQVAVTRFEPGANTQGTLHGWTVTASPYQTTPGLP